jgi:signal transduction histidine kinase
MKISTLIFVGFSIILLLFSATTYVNYKQSQVIKENTEWVATSQQVIRSSSRLQRNIIDMESGLRGYLFTGETIFLEPYDSAAAENIILFKEIKEQVFNGTEQEKRLLAIQDLHKRWRTDFAEPLITAKENAWLSDSALTEFHKLYNDKAAKRTENDISFAIRENFKNFSNYEYQLREQRKANLDSSVARTKLLSIILTSASIVIGLAIAFYITFTISQRINKMVNLADRIANGNFNTLIADVARDELGKLSRSLNSMSNILNENITNLELKNQELDRFAYVVSHDLKAPLRGIENASTWIEEDYGDALPEKVREYLALMKGRIRRMENLIDGILELSRIGKEGKMVEEVDLQSMLIEIIDMLAPPHEIKFLIQPGMPVFITDRLPLQQVFTNLISNAIKYNDGKDGKIKISYKDTGRFYEFSVTDNGPGIEPQYHDKIFIIFQTLKERDAFESTGVGLAIVKKILDDKRCTIKVKSDSGKGAVFTFSWPKTI